MYSYITCGDELVWVSSDGKRSAIAVCNDLKKFYLYKHSNSAIPCWYNGAAVSRQLARYLLKDIYPPWRLLP